MGKHVIITSLHRTQLTGPTFKCAHGSSCCVVKYNTQLARHPRLLSIQKAPTKCDDFHATVLMNWVESNKHIIYEESVIKRNLILFFYLKVFHLVSGLPGTQYTDAPAIMNRK